MRLGTWDWDKSNEQHALAERLLQVIFLHEAAWNELGPRDSVVHDQFVNNLVACIRSKSGLISFVLVSSFILSSISMLGYVTVLKLDLMK
jgi:hypothetical protein